MDKSIFARFFLLALLFILISTCARISNPSGGPRDKLPPVVTKNIPQSGTKNFRGDSFVITFNEYVVLDNINEKFMVSPPMKKKPRILIKGKSIIVEFVDKLKDSTTYTFYFQDAIKDLNEGNILENYKFVFSTGPVIDSLSVTGNVYNSLNLEVPEKTMALMYRELADSAVVKHFPDYISTVDQNGYFRIDNVRPGNYRIYALKDVDNSKNYNLTEEEFAFINSPVAITAEKNFMPVVKDTITVRKGANKVAKPVAKGATTVKKGVSKVSGSAVKDTTTAMIKGEFQLILFTAQRKEHYLTRSSRDLKYQMIYTLSLPPDSMKFEFSIPGTGEDAYFIERSRNKDTLKVWLTDSTLYKQPQITTIVKYPFTDTLKTLGYKEDTILMRFLAPRAPRVAKVKKSLFTVNTNITTGFLKPGQSVFFSSQTPFRSPDTSRIRLYELKDTIRRKVPFLFTKDSTNSCKYILAAKLLEGKNYLFIADSASFGNIYNEYSDSTGIKFSVREANYYNKLTLDIRDSTGIKFSVREADSSNKLTLDNRNYEGDRIIQLLDNTEKLVREGHMKKDGKIVFPLLESGLYRVRIIYDINGDGKWTTGDFESGRQPEPVSYYMQELNIKTGWDVENEWNIKTLNFKNQNLRAKKK